MYLNQIIEEINRGLYDETSKLFVIKKREGYVKTDKQNDQGYKVLVTTEDPLKATRYSLLDVLGGIPFTSKEDIRERFNSIEKIVTDEIEFYYWDDKRVEVVKEFLTKLGLWAGAE